MKNIAHKYIRSPKSSFIIILLALSLQTLTSVFIASFPFFPSTTHSTPTIIAFYYPWYSNSTDYSSPSPLIGDDTASRHWWDCQGVYSGDSDICSGYYPVHGTYDSADPDLIKSHLLDAKTAGIDVFSVSFWCSSSDCDQVTNVLNVAKSMHEDGIDIPSIAFLYEPDKLDDSLSPDQLIEEILSDFEVIESMSDNNYDIIFRIEDKPAVFIYTPFILTDSSYVWESVTKQSNLWLSADRPHMITNIRRDQVNFAALFDGVFCYDAYEPFYNNQYLSDTLHMFTIARAAGIQTLAAALTPGFNDTLVRDGHPPLSRDNGAVLREMWQHATHTRVSMLTLTSWNEWHESTQIEPACSDLPSYMAYEGGPDSYLHLTGQLAAEWKAGASGVQLSASLPSAFAAWCSVMGGLAMMMLLGGGPLISQVGMPWSVVITLTTSALGVVGMVIAWSTPAVVYQSSWVLWMGLMLMVLVLVVGLTEWTCYRMRASRRERAQGCE